jgi:hypothetical protein
MISLGLLVALFALPLVAPGVLQLAPSPGLDIGLMVCGVVYIAVGWAWAYRALGPARSWLVVGRPMMVIGVGYGFVAVHLWRYLGSPNGVAHWITGAFTYVGITLVLAGAVMRLWEWGHGERAVNVGRGTA